MSACFMFVVVSAAVRRFVPFVVDVYDAVFVFGLFLADIHELLIIDVVLFKISYDALEELVVKRIRYRVIALGARLREVVVFARGFLEYLARCLLLFLACLFL